MRELFSYVVAGIVLGTAWLVPLTPLGAALGWLSAVLFLRAMTRGDRGYRAMWIAGMVAVVLGFHWLLFTIRDFGFFGLAPALAIFALFVAGTALQFVVFLLAFRMLPVVLSTAALRAPVAWILSGYLSIRIFPWSFSHTQSGFLEMAQIASIAGESAISFLMLWCAEAAVLAVRGRGGALHALPGAALVAALIFGFWSRGSAGELGGTPLRVALIQGNIPLAMKHDRKSTAQNIERYAELSRPYDAPGTLILWPETAIMYWINDALSSTAQDPRMPSPLRGASMIVGALSYQSEQRLFNSAFGIAPDGAVLPPYHKQILMPFGEYTPFGRYLPWLKALNSTAADFTPGEAGVLLNIPIRAEDGSLTHAASAPLICYEDVIPGPSRISTINGAELLVNITNDLWFGQTVAPLQHHQIALFRAIENRRFLVRVTNSGLTAVVNPYGETVAEIPPFSDATLLAKVNLIGYKTVYTALFGEWPWRFTALAGGLLVVRRLIRMRRRANAGR